MLSDNPTLKSNKRANDLDGKEWTRASISVWSDIRRSPEEMALKHPAMFPTELVKRVIRCFTRDDETVILDPFCGSGSTLVAARELNRQGIGFEVAADYVELAHARLRRAGSAADDYRLHHTDSRRIPELLAAESVDLCITSPPYWDILSRRRTADYKEVRDYSASEDDLSRTQDYDAFIERLGEVFDGIFTALRPGRYCVINVMDLRKKSVFFPLHSDLAARLTQPKLGGKFIYDDLIIWDRRADYNNLRPLGYPAVFRINKVHEFLLILRKPLDAVVPKPGSP